MSVAVELYAACIVEYIASLKSGTFKGRHEDLIVKSATKFDNPQDPRCFTEATELLEEHGVLVAHVHDDMPIYYLGKSSKFFSVFGLFEKTGSLRAYSMGKHFNESNVPDFELLESYCDLGTDWLNEALEIHRERFWQELDSAALQARVPATDRIVKTSDNQARVSELEQVLDEIKSKVDFDNEVGAALGNLREIASEEIASLQSDLKKPAFRPSSLLDKARNTLEWLGKKVADTSVAELVKSAIKLFMEWLI